MSECFDEHGRPTLVKVGAVDYTVLWVDVQQARAIRTCAQQDPWYQTIQLLDVVPPTGLAVDFVHELFHALRYQSPVAGNEDEITEEQAAQLCAVGLTAFWRDNPRTFAWWRGLVGLDDAP